MTLPDMPAVVETDEGVRDFSRHRTVKFNIDHADGTKHIFYCVAGLPALTLVDFIAKVEATEGQEDIASQINLLREIFEMVLDEETSLRPFMDRLADRKDPIELQQAMDALQYVMGEYGLRPTTRPEQSVGPSENQGPGTSSGASSSSRELISADLPSTNSSTLLTTTS